MTQTLPVHDFTAVMWHEKPNGIRYLQDLRDGTLVRDRWYAYFDEGATRLEAQTIDELRDNRRVTCAVPDALVVQAGHHKFVDQVESREMRLNQSFR